MFLTIETTSVAKAWIQALQRVFFEGDIIKTQYDKDDDFPSKDCTSAIHVTDPFSEPMLVAGKPYLINKLPVYCHSGDIYCTESIKGGYLKEVMSGAMDFHIWEGKESYPYTYHDRLFNYRGINKEDIKYIEEKINESPWIGGFINHHFGDPWSVDQVEVIIKHLKKSPYTRRAQAITWRPIADNLREDPPCLQRIWFRIFDGKLRMNAHWRSRDLFGAWEANVNGMLQIGQMVAKEVSVEFGEYFDFCDSLHIYGKKKKLYKELIPLLERVRRREGLLTPEYERRLDPWIEEAQKCENNN